MNILYILLVQNETNKVFQEIGCDLWECQKWNELVQKPLYSYILLGMISDGIINGYIWVNFFKKEAEHILGGLTVNEFQKWLESESTDKEALMDIGMNSRWKHYKITIKVIKDSYQGVIRSRYHAIKVEKVSYSEENSRLISILNNYNF